MNPIPQLSLYAPYLQSQVLFILHNFSSFFLLLSIRAKGSYWFDH